MKPRNLAAGLLVGSAAAWAVMSIIWLGTLWFSIDSPIAGTAVVVLYFVTRFLLFLGILAFGYAWPQKHKVWVVAGMLLVALIGFLVFQYHESQIKKRATSQCLEVAQSEKTALDSAQYNSLIESCYKR